MMGNRQMGILGLGVILAVLCLSSVAWGVVGEIRITVKDQTGRPVPGATIRLTPTDPNLPEKEATTDQERKVSFSVEQDRYGVEVRSPDHVRTRTEITVRGGETTSTVVFLTPIFPWMVQNPGGILGGFGISLSYLGEWRDDLRNTSFKETIRTKESGTFDDIPFSRSRTAVNITDPNKANQENDFEWDSNGGQVDLTFSLPRWRISNPLWLYPAINIAVGGADVNFDFKNKVDPRLSTSFKGGGPMVGVGLDLVLSLGDTSPWFVGAGYQFRTIPRMDLDRSPSLPDRPFRTMKDDASLSYHSHSVYGRLGYSLFNNRVAPYLGIRGNWANVDFESETESRFKGFTLEAIDTTRLEAEFERRTAEGLAGVDVRFWGPLFGRAEAAFTDSDVAVQVMLVYGFGFVDP